MKRLLTVILFVLLCFNSCSAPKNLDSEGRISPDEYLRVNELVTNYCFVYDLLPEFSEGQTVPIDNLLLYFYSFQVLDSETGDYLDIWKPYKTASYDLKIPKKLVKEAIESRFAVNIDDRKSAFAVGDYLIVGGETYDDGPLSTIHGFAIYDHSIKVEGSVFDYGLTFKGDEEEWAYTYNKSFEICIKNYGTDDYKFISCRFYKD